MGKRNIFIIFIILLFAGSAAAFVMGEQKKKPESGIKEKIKTACDVGQGYNPEYEKSPFGFLNQYFDNQKTRKIYSAYGGFQEIQKTYKDLGVHWDRGSGMEGGISYSQLMYIPGYADEFRNYLKAAAENDINLVVTIDSTLGRKQDGKIPKNISQYADFVGELAKECKSVKYWQIQNEINGKVFWKDTPENYAKLVRVTSDAIRKNCPDCRIVLGSSINIGSTGELIPQDYFKDVLADLGRDGKRYFDIFDYHFFSPKEFTPDNYFLDYPRGLREMRNLLGQAGFGDAKIWTTETMIFTSDGMDLKKLPPSYGRGINETQQAAALFKTYVIGLANGVEKIFWNKLTEGSWFDPKFDRAGLIRHPEKSGSADKKLSYFVYKLMVDKLDGSDWKKTETIQEKDGVHVYRFFKNGKSIFVAWNDDQDMKEVVIPVSLKKIRVTEAGPRHKAGKEIIDYDSAFRSEVKNVNGSFKIGLGDMPIFIEE